VLQEKTISESDLVTGLIRGDNKCFRIMFDRYSKPLFVFSMSYIKSKEDAENIVQEAFMKIWRNREKLKSDTSFQSYLFTIALNLIRKYFNKSARLNKLKHDILLDAADNKLNFDDRNDYQLMLDNLEELIGKMPEKRKVAFVKKKIEEKSLKEISEEMSISTKTVEYHITEAMKYLKEEFGKIRVKLLT
jgi:RNA polymerase sigma-70 factor (ECF subfamily)